MRRVNWLIFVLLSETLVTWAVGQHYRIPCKHAKDCDHANTHLSCLKSPSGIKICECRRGETLVQGECTGNVGAACEVGGKRKCTSGAFCNPNEGGGGTCQCMPGYLENDTFKICEKVPYNPFHHSCERSTGDEYCKTESTGLKCLKVPGLSEYKCDCRGTAVFDSTALKCRLPVGAVCEVQSAKSQNPIECDGAARCIATDNSAYGVCAYAVTMMETQNLVNRGQYDSPCDRQNGEIQCDSDSTGLKCLKIPDTKAYKCRCRGGGKFDETARKCRLGVGETCEIKNDAIECIASATCVPMDKSDEAIVGICSERREMSMEIHSQSQTKDVLFNKTCNEDHDCHHHKTHLKCLLDSGRKLCQCRHNSVFDLDDQVCYHGVGNRCQLPSYRDRNPQVCFRGRADCVPDSESSYEGTCVCRKNEDCHSHKSLPKSAPSVSSIYSNACQGHSYLLSLSICTVVLVFFK